MPRTLTYVLLLFVLLTGSVRHARGEEPRRRKPRRVAVLPVQRLDVPCASLFSPDVREELDTRTLDRTIRRALASLPDVTPVSAHDLRQRVSGRSTYKDKVIIGRERYHMGHEYYRDLRQAEAVESLQRAVALLDSIFYDAVEPQALSEILFLLGISQVELDQVPEAHQAFKRALFLSPLTSFTAGYHPKPVEQAMAVACEDLHRSMSREIPLGTVERTLEFMKRHNIDTLFYPVVVRDEKGRNLLLVGYEGKSRTIAFRASIPFEAELDEETLERVDQAVTRWAACAPFANVQRQAVEPSRWLLSAGSLHALYLQNPLRTPLWAMGFSFDGSHFFTRAFALQVKGQFLSSMPDRFEDMLDGFTAARLLLGPSFSASGRWWRLYISPLAEFHYMGSFRVTSDPDCKQFDKDSAGWSAQCDPKRIKDFPVEFLVGVNVQGGAQFFLSKEVFLGVSASISTYFAPFDRSFDINFPVAVEAGGGVAF